MSVDNIILATCVAEDESRADRRVNYPSISRQGVRARSRTYWQCAMVSLATTLRVLPAARRLIFTNRPLDRIGADSDIRDFCRNHGIDIQYVPFGDFRPPDGVSHAFKNAFYKHAVLAHLAETESGSCFLFDSDCVWVRYPQRLLDAVAAGEFLAIELTLGRSPDETSDGLSQNGIASALREFIPDCTTTLPRWYGGEFFGGSPQELRTATQALRITHRQLGKLAPEAVPKLPNGRGVFDNDEYLAMIAWNRPGLSVTPVNAFVARLWTGHDGVRTLRDLEFDIWHLPAEKDQGFVSLTREVLDPHSEFWKCDVQRFPNLLGGFLGIPQRTKPIPRSLTSAWTITLKRYARNLLPSQAWDRFRAMIYG